MHVYVGADERQQAGEQQGPEQAGGACDIYDSRTLQIRTDMSTSGGGTASNRSCVEFSHDDGRWLADGRRGAQP